LRPAVDELAFAINAQRPEAHAAIATFDVDHRQVIRRQTDHAWRHLIFGRFTDAPQPAKHDMLAVGFDEQRFARADDAFARLNGLNEQIAKADLNGRVNVQFRLLDRKNALLASKAADNHRDHLRNADTHIARRDDDALF